jgi:hypothetical protein
MIPAVIIVAITIVKHFRHVVGQSVGLIRIVAELVVIIAAVAVEVIVVIVTLAAGRLNVLLTITDPMNFIIIIIIIVQHPSMRMISMFRFEKIPFMMMIMTIYQVKYDSFKHFEHVRTKQKYKFRCDFRCRYIIICRVLLYYFWRD